MRIGNRHLNRNLAKAIDERWPMWWRYEDYGKYYRGFVLHGSSGHCENGKVFDRKVFCTTSPKGAMEIQEILQISGVQGNGLKEAMEQHKAEQNQRNRLRNQLGE
jgi:hypothetical protein